MSDLANVRRGRDFTAYFRFGRRAGARRGEQEKPLPLGRQLLLQAILLAISATVLFPIFWVFSISIDARGLFRPDGLNLIPPEITFQAYQKVLAQPTSNNISFLGLMLNSLKIALFSSAEELVTVIIESEDLAESERKKFDLLWELVGHSPSD